MVNLCVDCCMLMNSVLHNFSLRSDSVGRLAAVMASVYDLPWKMNRIARFWMYSICLVCFFVRLVCHTWHAYCNTDRTIEVYMLMRW